MLGDGTAVVEQATPSYRAILPHCQLLERALPLPFPLLAFFEPVAAVPVSLLGPLSPQEQQQGLARSSPALAAAHEA